MTRQLPDFSATSFPAFTAQTFFDAAATARPTFAPFGTEILTSAATRAAVKPDFETVGTVVVVVVTAAVVAVDDVAEATVVDVVDDVLEVVDDVLDVVVVVVTVTALALAGEMWCTHPPVIRLEKTSMLRFVPSAVVRPIFVPVLSLKYKKLPPQTIFIAGGMPTLEGTAAYACRLPVGDEALMVEIPVSNDVPSWS